MLIEILLINKILHFHYQLLQGGSAPPAVALPNFLGDHFEP